MNALLLRSAQAPAGGSLPHWAAPAACDDMWIRLFMAAADAGGWASATVQAVAQKPHTASWGKGRTVQWVTAFGLPTPVDVLLVRGRYSYAPALDKHKGAFKVFLPCGSGVDTAPDRGFDLVLVDSERQVAAAQARFKRARIAVFPKPALDSIFKPVAVEKDFDVVFNCHRLDDFKGYSWLVKRLPPRTKVLRIGPPDPWFAGAAHLETTWTGRIPKQDIPKWACRARVGLVADDGKWDSGPRILPEYLAMGLPVLCRDAVRVSDRYFSNATGRRVGDDVAEFKQALSRLWLAAPYMQTAEHYRKHLSLAVAAAALCRLIAEGMRK